MILKLISLYFGNRDSGWKWLRNGKRWIFRTYKNNEREKRKHPRKEKITSPAGKPRLKPELDIKLAWVIVVRKTQFYKLSLVNSVLGTKIFLCYSPETRSKQITVASVIRADFCSLKKSITFFKIQSNPALRSPHYYEQFALSLGKKALTFSLISTRVIRTLSMVPSTCPY